MNSVRHHHGGAAAVAGLWLVLQAWQPFFFGLYGDDWSWVDCGRIGAPFSAARFLQAGIWGVSRSRPVYAVAYFVTSSLAGTSPLLIRFAGSVALLGTMLAMYVFVGALLRLGRIDDTRLSVGAAALWLLMPWTVFAKVSPTAALAYLSAIFFLSAAAIFWTSVERGRPQALAPAFLQFLSYLTYEAFYLQFAAVLLVAYGYNRSSRRPIFTLLRPAAAFSIAQVLALAYNRLSHSPKTPAGMRAGLLKFAYNVTVGPIDVLISSAYLYAAGIAVSVVVAAVLFRATVRRLPGDERSCQRRLLWALMSGAILALATYAAANYSLTGRDAYTSFSADVWLAAAGALTIGVLLKHGTTSTPTRAALAAGIMCMLAADAGRLNDWRIAGLRQNDWIAGAPVELIRSTPEDAVIFYDGPTRYEGAWVYDRPSVLERQFARRFGFSRRFYVHEQSRVVWSPDEVREDLGIVGRFRVAPTIRVREPWYYWNPDIGEFRRLTTTFESKDTRLDTLPFAEMVKFRHWPIVGAARLLNRLRSAR